MRPKSIQKTVCFVSVAKFDEFSGGVDRVACFLIRYFKSRGYRVISYYWRSYTDNGDYALIDHSYQFPRDNINYDHNIHFLIDIIGKEQVSLIFDISFVERIHEICYKAKKSSCVKSILLYQGDPFAYTKSLIDKNDFLKFEHCSCFSRVINRLKTPFSYVGRYNSAKELHRHNLLYSDCYVVLSQCFVEKILRLLHIKATNRIYAIPNSVEPFSLKEKKKQVVFVGRMDWQKRVDRLLRIWKKASVSLPDWNLVLVGDGPYLDNFKQYARTLSLTHYAFVGAQKAQDFIEESSVLCLTSTHEGFGLTLVEAQSCGCVPIAFDSYDAVEDIIEDKVSGILVHPFCEKSYAQKLIDLCMNFDFRYYLSQQCAQNAKRFSPDVIEQKWDVILNRLSEN